MNTRFAALAALALAVGPAACTRGGDKKEEAPKEAVAEQEKPALDPYWEKGKLPPSMQEGQAQDGGTLTVWWPSEAVHLMNLIEPDWWMGRMTEHQIFESLVRNDPYDHPRYRQVPELAESWEISDDHLTYTFKLRQGVTWHDGKPFTADDVIFTFDTLMNPKVKAASLRSYFEDLKTWKKLDESTVQLTYKKPYWMALGILGDVTILPKHVYGKGDFNKHPALRAPIGTGPYKFDKWDEGRQVVLSRNDNYWGKKGHLEKIVWRYVNDQSVAMQLMEKGEMDFGMHFRPEQYVSFPDSKRFKENYWRLKFDDANYVWIGWNQKKPFFQDKRVRQALTYLTDVAKIRKTLLHDLYIPTACHFYHAGEDCDQNVKQYPYDPPKALALLKEAGWEDHDKDGVLDKDGVAFKFTYLYSAGSQTAEDVGKVMKEAFHKAGIDMDMAKTEWALFVKRLREHEFDAVTLVWGGGAHGDPKQIWHSKQTDDGSNYVFFNSPEADKLIDLAQTEFDAEKRHAMYRDFGKILYEEQPYLWLGSRPRLGLLHKKLKGVRDSLEFVQLRDWWIDPSWKEPSVAGNEAPAPARPQ